MLHHIYCYISDEFGFNPSKHETASTLVQHCTHVTQMFCVFWDAARAQLNIILSIKLLVVQICLFFELNLQQCVAMSLQVQTT